MIYPKPQSGVFAQDAPESEIKPFDAWLRGLGIAFDETNGFPDIESFNGLLQTLNSYIKYLEQNGFAEWTADLEYPIGAGVRVGSIWYRAKTQNTNKNPATSQNDWAVFLNASDLTYSDPLQNVGGVISVKDATTTQRGVTRFATAAEVSNRTNVGAAITPANVGQTFSQNLATNGWCRLPNGLILQWGTAPIGSGTRSFPISFTVTPFYFGINKKAVLSINDDWDSTSGMAISATSYRYLAEGSSANWLAIGY